MSQTKFATVLFVAFPAIAAAQMPLPELRTEPTAGGSIFYIRNNSPQPLNVYLIELVDYPGSSYSLWQDETVADPIPPKGEKRIQVANMTVGAVPDYVKMQAALYAGGTTAGIPEKVAQLLDRRRSMLESTRQLIGRMEKAQAGGTAKAALVADLKPINTTSVPGILASAAQSTLLAGDDGPSWPVTMVTLDACSRWVSGRSEEHTSELQSL